MKTLINLCVAVAVVVVYGVLTAVETIRERRLKRELGAAYEGPLDGEGEV